MAYNQSTTFTVPLIDGVLTQATYSSGTITISSTGTAYTQTIYKTSASVTFPAYDLGKYFNGSTVINKTVTLNGGTVTISTATSTDNVTFTSFSAINSDGTITSAQGRYLKVKLDFTPATTNNSVTISDFVSGESSNFGSPSGIVFDGSAYLQTVFTLPLTKDNTWTDSSTQLYAITLDRTQYGAITSASIA